MKINIRWTDDILYVGGALLHLPREPDTTGVQWILWMSLLCFFFFFFFNKHYYFNIYSVLSQLRFCMKIQHYGLTMQHSMQSEQNSLLAIVSWNLELLPFGTHQDRCWFHPQEGVIMWPNLNSTVEPIVCRFVLQDGQTFVLSDSEGFEELCIRYVSMSDVQWVFFPPQSPFL